MIENLILFQTRLEQLEFDDQDEVVPGPLIDFYGSYICKGDDYFTSGDGDIIMFENLEQYVQEELLFSLYTKK